ncbi:hypothetical protein BGZ70_002313 [Mortierella alpina]|uniref:Uncharacterized protein n=1 Tax=Mortierella alpina TaxID=64518 RepID=A0A9P6IUA3_MORAP|nr:hypothetical protein BGZ70_002313 [Mortierella alpina]
MSNRTHSAATPFRNDSLPANPHDLRHGASQTQGIHHSPASASPVAASLQGVHAAPHAVPGPQQQQHPHPHQHHQQQQQQQQQEVEESSEQVLLASFKAAALSVTQLYKDSLKHQRAEHAKGYEAALQDFLAFIANHPAVQEKKEQGQSEDEIRQSTSLSVDEIVSFISNARSMNCSAAGNEALQHQPHQQQQQQHHIHGQEQQQQQQQLQQQQILQQQQQQQYLQQQQQEQEQQRQQQQQQQQQHQQHQQEQQQQSHQSHQQQPLGTLQPSAGAAGLPPPASAPIFPSDAFTFTAPIFHPGLDQSSLQGLYSGPEGGIGQQMAVDSLKRRYALQDFNIAANRMAAANATRLSNPMNLDVFSAFHDQPPFKRGRRREGEQ